jgi:reactive intermediate/imine deaminase
MTIQRYGVEGGKGTGGQHLPFARAVKADGWLYVSGQVPMLNGELVGGTVTAQAEQAIQNLLSILREAGYGPEHVVRCGVWLEDPRDFQSFNAVFRKHFGENPPARACVVSSMVVDCKVEIDCVAYKSPL